MPVDKEIQGELQSHELKSILYHITTNIESKTNMDSLHENKSQLTKLTENLDNQDMPSKTHLLAEEKGEEEIKDKYQFISKSVPSSVNVNPNLIAVRFTFNNVNLLSAFKLTTTVEEIKRNIEYVLELKKDFLTFECEDIEAKDLQTLADLGGQSYGTVVFKMFSKEGEKGNAILAIKIAENIPTLDVITVHLGELGHARDTILKIENKNVAKKWLGGYRNKLTGTEYHNADTQTMKTKVFFKIDEVSGKNVPLFINRDTQTPFPPKTNKFDTGVNKSTQMSRPDLYITSKSDKIITSRSYSAFTSPSLDKKFVKTIITLQRAIRKWFQIRKFRELVKIQSELWRRFKREEKQIKKEQAEKERAIITSSAYPVNRNDFYMLFLIVEQWWKKEWKKICESKSSEPKKATSVLLIEKEILLLGEIEKHKIVEKSESLKKKQINFLEQASRPVVFRNSKGRLITIDYLDIQKAREFKEIYSALVRKDISPKDRIEMLITLKKSFESCYMDYEYAMDLVSLISREIELLGIGMKYNDLRGLQKRIEQLYINFLHQKEYNPAASKYRKPKSLTEHKKFQCSRCSKLLPASKFTVHVRLKSYVQCKSCTWMQNMAQHRVDMSPYLKLLKNIQNSEMLKCCYSAVCFILQPIGMGYLTNIIWHGRSAISECADLSKLQHIRWLPDVEWAPWNTILLTNQEANLHASIPNIFEFYDDSFIEKVHQKHMSARKEFIPLLVMDHHISSSGSWSNITDSGDFLHPSHAVRLATQDDEYDTI